MTETSRDRPDSDCMNTSSGRRIHNNINSCSKPAVSHVALIATAILNSESRKMLLSQIFQWVTDHFPYFKMTALSWRNSIRHNLSVNECFVKCDRSKAGKGHYWTVHPVNVDDFIRGDFRRRRARQRVHRLHQHCLSSEGRSKSDSTVTSSDLYTSSAVGYVTMTAKTVTTSHLVREFGFDVSSTG